MFHLVNRIRQQDRQPVSVGVNDDACLRPLKMHRISRHLDSHCEESYRHLAYADLEEGANRW